jgi:hypothetical protein
MSIKCQNLIAQTIANGFTRRNRAPPSFAEAKIATDSCQLRAVIPSSLAIIAAEATGRDEIVHNGVSIQARVSTQVIYSRTTGPEGPASDRWRLRSFQSSQDLLLISEDETL